MTRREFDQRTKRDNGRPMGAAELIAYRASRFRMPNPAVPEHDFVSLRAQARARYQAIHDAARPTLGRWSIFRAWAAVRRARREPLLGGSIAFR